MSDLSYLTRFFNLCLKFSGLISKLLLILLLSSKASGEEFGYYGLFNSLVVYLVGFIGLEYHASSNREVCHLGIRRDLFSNHFIFSLVTVSLSVIISFIVLFFELLPCKYLYFFIVILIFEYLSTELIRYLNMTERQIFSSVVFFIKTSAWILPYSIYLFLGGGFDIATFYLIWLIFSIVSVCLGFLSIKKDFNSYFSIKEVSFCFILDKIKKSKFIFISSQLILVLTVLDRYLINFYSSVEIVGIYVFYFMLTNSLTSILESTVFVFFIPKIILLYNKNETESFSKLIKKLYIDVLIVGLLSSLIMFMFIDEVLEIVNKESYISYIVVFYVLLGSSLVKLISLVPHYVLYSLKKDGISLNINILSLILFLLLALILLFSGIEPIMSVSISIFLINCLNFFIKLYYARFFRLIK